MLQVFLVFGVLVALNIGITSSVSEAIYDEQEGSVTIDNIKIEPKNNLSKQQ